MEKIRHALRGEETVQSMAPSKIHAPRNFSSDSRRHGGKRSASKIRGDDGRPNMNAPSNKRSFLYQTSGSESVPGRPSASSDGLDLSSNIRFPSHVSFATPGNTGGTALQSLLQKYSSAGSKPQTNTTTRKDLVAPSRSVQFLNHPRTSRSPSSIPPSTKATRSGTSISNSVQSVLLEQQRQHQQQQQQQTQSNLLGDLLSGHSPSNSNDLQQMILQSLLGQQQNQTQHPSTSQIHDGNNSNTISLTIDRNQSILERDLLQQ